MTRDEAINLCIWAYNQGYESAIAALQAGRVSDEEMRELFKKHVEARLPNDLSDDDVSWAGGGE